MGIGLAQAGLGFSLSLAGPLLLYWRMVKLLDRPLVFMSLNFLTQQRTISNNVRMTMMTVLAEMAMIMLKDLSSAFTSISLESIKERRSSFSSTPALFLAMHVYNPMEALVMFMIVRIEKMVVLCPLPDLVCLMLYKSLVSGMVWPPSLQIIDGVGLPVTWQCRGTTWPGRTECWWGRDTEGEQEKSEGWRLLHCLLERDCGLEHVALLGTMFL